MPASTQMTLPMLAALSLSGTFVLAAAGLVCLLWRGLLQRTSVPSHQAELEVFRATRRDSLTKLTSRRAFIEMLAAHLQAGESAALLLIDLDGFAALNAAHGQRAGDEVLVAMASRLRALTPNASHAARLCGDQLALLLPGVFGVDAISASALAVVRALGVPVPVAGRQLACPVSLGVAMLPSQADTPDAALNAASAALADAKRAGGAGWRFFDPDRETALRQRAALAEELRAGIAANAIIPYYQPIVDLVEGRLVGLEVLARWRHPTRGIVPPDLFIPLAEEMNLTGQITQQLMRRLIADSREWPAWLYFAFNVSPGQLRELIGMIRNPPLWPEGMLDPHRLEVEVTESAMIEDLEVAREVIALLQLRGTRVVLDDFGIGFSNFFHLRELPFDRIKIDRSFVMDIESDPRAEACVRAMLALGGSLGVPMVAEGVEDAQTEARVASLGCRFGQGYYYSEPVPASAVAGLLRRWSGRPAERVVLRA